MTVRLEDSDFTLHVGDVRDVLAELPADSVHCVVTSPPYWGLRDYGTVGQLGLEPTPAEYVQNMVDVFRQVRRVLRADGTLWLNLGDSYASGEVGRVDLSQYTGSGGLTREKHPIADNHKHADQKPRAERRIRQQTGLKPKDLVGIPWRVAFALQNDGWYLRSDIIWAKPNPMPESVTDRPTKAHEYLFLLTKSPRYYFDQEAVREPHQGIVRANFDGHRGELPKADVPGRTAQRDRAGNHENGRNVRSVWEIATQPYPDAHFATFPEELPRRCIAAGTSEHGVCPECGAPWEREVETTYKRHENWFGPKQDARHSRGSAGTSYNEPIGTTTTGWQPTCNHDGPPIPATVLDPFAGSGTTNHVARKHGRRSIGIELNPHYAQLAAQRMSQLSLLT